MTGGLFLVAPSIVWYGQATLSLIVLFLLAVAVRLEWDRISRGWRRVLILGVIEHAVIAYGSVEARHSDVPVELRVFLLTLTLTGLVIALLILLIDLIDTRRHPRRQVPRA